MSPQVERIPPRDRAIADDDLARIRRQQSIDQFEDGALAGTAAPDKGQGLTLHDLEVEALKHRRAASLQPDSAEGNLGHGAALDA
jgi:hypothetical protein